MMLFNLFALWHDLSKFECARLFLAFMDIGEIALNGKDGFFLMQLLLLHLDIIEIKSLYLKYLTSLIII